MALSSSEALFVQGVSSKTGIDPRVLVAWVEQEGAGAPGGTGHFNYLNLRPTSGDVYAAESSGGFEQFANVGQAVSATVRRLEMPFAAPIITAAKGKATPAAQIAAIASTGWDAAHYGGAGGPSLANTFASIFSKAGLTSGYEGPSAALAVASTAGTGSASDWTSVNPIASAHNTVSGAANKIPNPFNVPNPLDWVDKITSWLKNESGLALAYIVLVAVAGALLVTGLKGLGAPTPRLPRVVPV